MDQEIAREKREARSAKAQATKQSNEQQRAAAINAELQASGVNMQRLFQVNELAEEEYEHLCRTRSGTAGSLIGMWERPRN